ncbi:MAG: efflux RND transporter periplasmic adaptor subunit [Gammaproteobacteria bacterium]|nr:efflux RND transporter periplasmic adaptor subunit [Gammaproteobacteria bacterium]
MPGRLLVLIFMGLLTVNKLFAADLATATVEQVELPKLSVVDATIEAVQQATVSAQVSGRILEINFDVDDYVEKGKVLIRLRDKEQRAAFDAAKARFEEAEKEYTRVKDVYDKKLVAKAALDRAEAQLKASRAAQDQAKEALENTVIRAPYSGIVVKRLVEVGETARPGEPLMTGLSLEKLRAVVNLPQSLIYTVREHKEAWAWVGEYQDTRVKADSLTISPYADPDSHTFLVRVNLPEGDHHIYPGMYTKVAFVTGKEMRLVIPRQAVAHRSEVTAVYVKGEKGIDLRQIRLGEGLPDNQVEVLAGLSAGEKVILDPVAAAAAITLASQTK